jgi:amidase
MDDCIVAEGGHLASAYAIAGYPAISVPAGREDWGTTLGLTFIGRYFEDAQLIGYAYAYEQASRLRELPPAATRE